MKWEDTIASQCRYGDVAARIFDGAEIIWERSMAGYQGYANVLAKMRDGTFIHYTWTYGSCSGCDEWESRGLSDDDIEKEMRSALAILSDRSALSRYLHLTDEFAEARLPTANNPQNGSIIGMMQYLGGGWGTDFEDMRKVATEWMNATQTI